MTFYIFLYIVSFFSSESPSYTPSHLCPIIFMAQKPPVSSSIFPKVTQKVQGLDLREHLRGENLILWQTGKKRVGNDGDMGKERLEERREAGGRGERREEVQGYENQVGKPPGAFESRKEKGERPMGGRSPVWDA